MKIIRILSHGAGGRSFEDHLTRRQQEAQREGLVQGYLKVPIIIKAKNKKKGKICDGKKARAARREARGIWKAAQWRKPES